MERIYQFVIVQVVSDVVRDERVNVGIIVRDTQHKTFDFQFSDRSAIIGETQRCVEDFETVLRRVKNNPRLSLDWMGNPSEDDFFARAGREFNGTLQFSGVRTYRGVEDLSGVLERNFQRLVA